MEVVKLLAGDGQAQVVGDVLTVKGDAAGGEAGGLVTAAAHGHDDRLGVAGDDGAAGDVEADRAADLVVLDNDIGDHGVVGVLDALFLQHGRKLGAAVMLDELLVIALVIAGTVGRIAAVVVEAALRGSLILVQDAPVAQTLIGALGFLQPDLIEVHVAQVLAAVLDALAQRVIIVAHFLVCPAVGARPRAQTGIARAALVKHDDALTLIGGRGRGVQTGETAADDQYVTFVFGFCRSLDLGDRKLGGDTLDEFRFALGVGRRHPGQSRDGGSGTEACHPLDEVPTADGFSHNIPPVKVMVLLCSDSILACFEGHWNGFCPSAGSADKLVC